MKTAGDCYTASSRKIGVVSATPFRVSSCRPSRQNRLHDFGLFDASKPEVEAGMAVGQFAMIEPHQLQHGGMEVVDMDPVFDGLVAELVGRAIGEAAFHAAAREPDREAVMVVIA